jgi:predicted esterase
MLLVRRITLLFLTCIVCFALQPAFAQEPKGFTAKVFQDETGNHKYSIFVPRGYSPDRKWPVILFLHGAGECGKDGVLQTTIGLGPYISAQADTFPFIAVFPQCEDNQGRIAMRWRPDQPDGMRALKILSEVEKTYQVDPQHRILMGWSMGAYGAWAMAAADPKHWSAMVSLSGGGDPAEVAKLKDLPIWVFHGAVDSVVKVDESRKIVEALKAAGGHPFYTEIPDLGHESYKAAFDRPEFYKWLMAAKPGTEPPLLVQPGTKFKAPPSNAPFIPAVHIPRAVYIRLGNEGLQVLSDAIPAMVTADMLSGRINDIQDSFSAEGRSFSVVFSGVSYAGSLHRAQIKAYAKDRVNVQLGIHHLQMTIGSTSVNGSGKSAWTGPISIVIGHQRPVWLSFDVKPYIDQGRIRLMPLETSFNIPQDNWYVTSPQGIGTRGIGMTADRVSSGLVNGLYGSKGRIESEIRSVVPSLVLQLEQRLTIPEIDQVVSSAWPIPVYQPRLRVWPQEISTDENGISLVLGATAAALSAEYAPKTPKWAASVGKAAVDVPRTTALSVGLAPGALTPISEMLVEKQMARINVLDTPVDALKMYADPKQLAEVIPDLKQYGDSVQLWAELILTKPLAVEDAAGKLQFDLPGLMVSIAMKPDANAKTWQPYAEVQFDITQPTSPNVLNPSLTVRAIEMKWDAEPTIKASARFAPGYEPKDKELKTERMEQLFAAGWKEWAQSGTGTHVAIPDVDFGYTRLRLKDVAWHSPNLTATFGKPGVQITNLTKEDFVFETKGPYSDWSQPFTLKPGASNYFNIAYPLLFRRTSPTGQIEMYTLPAGSFSEYRDPLTGGKAQLFQAKGTQAPPPPVVAPPPVAAPMDAASK